MPGIPIRSTHLFLSYYYYYYYYYFLLLFFFLLFSRVGLIGNPFLEGVSSLNKLLSFMINSVSLREDGNKV